MMALQLEVGKTYETRDGRAVGPIYWDDVDGRFACKGFEWGHWNFGWLKDGRQFSHRESENDLVRELVAVMAPGNGVLP